MDIMEEDDFDSPPEKKIRFDEEFGVGGDDDGGRGRPGRMRKKSAKVLEMEEFEETEKKQASMGKTPGGAKKKKALKPPGGLSDVEASMTSIPLTVMKDDSNDEMPVTDASFKMKLPFTPTGMAAGPPVNLPPPPPSSKSVSKKPPVKPKKEKMTVAPAPLSPPSSSLEAMLKSPTKNKNLFDSFPLSGEGEVSALQMALQAELSSPPISSTELLGSGSPSDIMVKKDVMGSPTHAPHLAAALLQAPINTSHSLLLSGGSSAANTSAGSHLDSSDDDLDSDGQLIIDTHRDGPKKKKAKKEKKTKVRVEHVLSPKDDSSIDRGGDSNLSSLDSDGGDMEDAPVYSNTDQMALKLMTSAEKKASKKKGKKQKKEDPEKPKKKRSPTAYMLWCNSYRGKVVAENPGIDFAQISKRLGEIWQSLPEKEKMLWKRKAKKAAGKGSTLISTGKGGSKAGPAPTKAAATAAKSAAEPRPASSKHSAKSVSFEDMLANTKHSGTGAVDVAAHLKLLGESLSIIGSRLQEHQGQIAVQGSLSVLLDSLLCALGPLMCLTQLVKEFNGSSPEVHAKTLDNIAYFMPGIG